MGLLSGVFNSSEPTAADHASALMDQIGLGVSVYRLEDASDAESLRLVYSNPASERITGLKAEAEVGRRLVDIAPGVRALGLHEVYAGVASGGEAVDLGVVEYEGEGTIPSAPYRVSAVPLAGRAVGILFENVSARQEVRALESARDELARQGSRYRSLVEATAAIVWTTPPSGELLGEQPGWRAFTGQSQAELSGAGWLDAIHPSDRADTHAAWQHAVATHGVYSVRHRLRTASGDYRTMQVRGVPVLRDGEVHEWVGIHTDIEDQESAALALAQSETRLRTLFDAVSDVVLVYPLEGTAPGPLRFVNRAAVETYGYSEGDLLQMTVADLVDPSSMDMGNAIAELRRVRRATFETTHQTREGRKIPMRTNARLVELDGELHVVALARDDTEGRQFRRELARANLGLEREVVKRTAQLEAFAEDLKLLHGITTAHHASPEARYRAYLEAGCEMFDLPIGILSATPTDPETGEQMYRLEAVVAPDPSLQPGLTVPLSEAFCDAVVAQQETVVYGDAAAEAPDHPACIGRGLRAFIGTPVMVDGELVGTLNFVSPEPRPDGFAPYERELIEVMADAVARRLSVDRAAEGQALAQERYRSIVETVGEAVIVVDPDGEVVQSNPMARQALGLTDDGSARWHVVNEHGSVLLSEDLPEREVMRSGQAVRGRLHGVLHPGGVTHWFRVNATPIDRDSDGVPEAVVVSFADVTDLQGASVAARTMRALLASVLDASPDGVMAFRAVRDAAGGIEDFEWLLANPRAGAITERDPASLVGRRLLDEFPGNRDAGLFDAYVRVVETGERYDTLVTYPHDGLDTTFRITATPISSDDGFTVTFAEVVPAQVLDGDT